MSPVGSNWALYPPNGTPPASERWRITTVHIQASAEEASLRGWYWRPVSYESLVPDTRKCIHCFKVIFEPLELTDAQKQLRHPLSTDVLLDAVRVPPAVTLLMDDTPFLQGDNELFGD